MVSNIRLMLTAVMFMAVSNGVVALELPAPLSAADVARYKQIFALQRESRWEEADAIKNTLDNDLLVGRMLAQRYMHPVGWRSSFDELRSWLREYNDHPHATRISRLARRRQPEGAEAAPPPKPDYLDGYGRVFGLSHYTRIPIDRSGRRSVAKTGEIAREVRKRIRSGWPTGAKNLLTENNLGYLTKAEEAILRADIAHGYFIFGKDGEAIEQSERAIALASGHVPAAFRTAGLAAWRGGNIPRAMGFFTTLLNDHAGAPDEHVSTAAFWAARGVANQDTAARNRYLEIAASKGGTFYGALASEALGREINLDFSLPAISDGYIAWLNDRPGGRRTFALLQVGETYYASRELRYLWEDMNIGQRMQTMALAARTRMAGLSFRTADILHRENGLVFHGGLYPLADFRSTAPLRVDPALLLALIRQESGFNPRAKSSAKASGLMQLLPATAAFISRDRGYRDNKRYALLFPETNIRLGEEYLLYLLEKPLIGGDLLLALAGYNGGPGNLGKWMDSINHGGDVLMVIESLPARETRFYVRNVITGMWIYSQLLGRDAPAIAAMAESALGGTQSRGGIPRPKCEVFHLADVCPGDRPRFAVAGDG